MAEAAAGAAVDGREADVAHWRAMWDPDARGDRTTFRQEWRLDPNARDIVSCRDLRSVPRKVPRSAPAGLVRDSSSLLRAQISVMRRSAVHFVRRGGGPPIEVVPTSASDRSVTAIVPENAGAGPVSLVRFISVPMNGLINYMTYVSPPPPAPSRSGQRSCRSASTAPRESRLRFPVR